MTDTIQGGGGDTLAGGGAAPTWTDGLAPEQAELVKGKGWQSPAEALTSYAQLEKLVGSDKIAVPGKDADDAVWNEIYGRLGRPDEPGKYELKKPEDAATLSYDDATADWFRGAAHKAGLNPRQAGTLHDAFVELQRKRLEADIAEVQKKDAERMAAFETKHGAQAAAKKEQALMAMKALGGEEFAQFLNESGLGTDPRMIETFVGIAEKIGEDGLKGSGAGLGLAMSKQDAETEYNKIRREAIADAKHPLMDAQHPEHKAVVDRVGQLFKIMFPEQAAA